jgi:hypothetical protein
VKTRPPQERVFRGNLRFVTADCATSASPAKAGSAFTVRVAIEDGHGTVQTGYSGSVTIALGSSPSDAALGGTTTVQASQGVATFSDLTIGQAAQGYTLRVTAGNLPPAGTAALNVTAPNNPPSNGGGGGSGSGGVQNNNSSSGNNQGGGPGTNSTGNTGGNGSQKGSSHKNHKSSKKGHHAGRAHKPPSRPLGHHPKPKSHHAKAVVHRVQQDIRSRPLLWRKLTDP